jgi:hypothetical protein
VHPRRGWGCASWVSVAGYVVVGVLGLVVTSKAYGQLHPLAAIPAALVTVVGMMVVHLFQAKAAVLAALGRGVRSIRGKLPS